jgi:hypothetical protein
MLFSKFFIPSIYSACKSYYTSAKGLISKCSKIYCKHTPVGLFAYIVMFGIPLYAETNLLLYYNKEVD